MQHDLPRWCATLATGLDAGALAALLLGAVIRFLPPTRRFRRYAGGVEGVLAVVSAMEWSLGGDHRLPLLAGQVVHLASSTGGRVLRERLIARVEAGAARLAPLSFAIVIAVGTIALALPIASRDGSPTSFVDAAFTATSATCVTGLAVRDTPTHFSSFGHWIILALMQIGGLGTMTLSLSLIAILRPPSARQREALMQVMGGTERVDVFRMVRFIAVATLVFEVIGWGLLVVFPGPASPSGSGKVFVGLFHAVSAFCNAGFSLWPDSLERATIPALITVSVLIIGGGLGFPILHDLSGALLGRRASRGTTAGGFDPNGHERVMRRRPGGWRGLSLHTRLGLVTTAFLIVGGAILVFFGEYDNTMRELPFGDKIAHAYFQSVTTRTAGFNSLPFGRFAPALLFAVCALMIIGACPGGTGGGIKTTTAASLVLSLRSLVSSRGRLEAFGRDLPDSLFQKAVAITLAYLGTLFLGVFLLLVIEPRPAMQLLFEATSALGTVGLSTGITPLLCVEAKLVLIALMFVGRVGPLALALSVGQSRPSGRYRYPSGDVIVG
jgi:trk system potassium uptake protein TrkH